MLSALCIYIYAGEARKRENWHLLLSDILIKFVQNRSLFSPPYNLSFYSKHHNLIGYYGNRKVKYEKTFKNHLLRSRKGDKFKLFQNCLYH